MQNELRQTRLQSLMAKQPVCATYISTAAVGTSHYYFKLILAAYLHFVSSTAIDMDNKARPVLDTRKRIVSSQAVFVLLPLGIVYVKSTFVYIRV